MLGIVFGTFGHFQIPIEITLKASSPQSALRPALQVRVFARAKPEDKLDAGPYVRFRV